MSDIKNKKLLKPKYDVVFHSLFRPGNENITKAIISDILGEKIEKINLKEDRHLYKYYPEEKLGILDVRAVLNEGTLCDIEIQLSDRRDTAERFLYYWSRLYGSQLKIADKYEDLNKTISILILDYELEKLEGLEDMHTIWKVYEEKHRVLLTDKLELHIIEIPKAIRDINKNIEDKITQWMIFLSDPNRGEVKRVMEKNKGIEEAMEKLEEISDDEELRRVAELKEKYLIDEMLAKAAERREKEKERLERERLEKERERLEKEKIRLKKEKEEERIKGEKEKIEIIKNMSKEGIKIETIAKIMNLSEEKIRDIIDN